ncbi:hypothetical protein QJS66_19555 [Kocuria rhizophila]|nr:hypothetical protein QJS66_19555 [Kocuria rhizophila]
MGLPICGCITTPGWPSAWCRLPAPWVIIAATGLIIAGLTWYPAVHSRHHDPARAGRGGPTLGRGGNFLDRHGNGADDLHTSWFRPSTWPTVLRCHHWAALMVGTFVHSASHPTPASPWATAPPDPPRPSAIGAPTCHRRDGVSTTDTSHHHLAKRSSTRSSLSSGHPGRCGDSRDHRLPGRPRGPPPSRTETPGRWCARQPGASKARMRSRAGGAPGRPSASPAGCLPLHRGPARRVRRHRHLRPPRPPPARAPQLRQRRPAVEAAAQQGQYEAMYQRMYADPDQWGDRPRTRARASAASPKTWAWTWPPSMPRSPPPPRPNESSSMLRRARGAGRGRDPTCFPHGEV